jgi:hypothetical protein
LLFLTNGLLTSFFNVVGLKCCMLLYEQGIDVCD